MSEEFMLNSLLNFGAPTLICIATIKYLGVRVEKLTDSINEALQFLLKMDKRLRDVEDAIEDLKKKG